MELWRIRLVQAACVLVLLATLRVEIQREQKFENVWRLDKVS